MNINLTRFIGAGLFFLVIFLSGFWLSRSGRPYNVIVMTIHKLISAAAFVLLIITLIRACRESPLGAMELISGVVAGLFFLTLIATGGLLSGNKEMPAAVLKLHRITPYLTVLFTAATLYLLQGRGW